MFIIYGNVQFVPGKYDAWQRAYDPLGEYVADKEHNSTLSYYFGVPIEYKSKPSATPHMLAFEAYNTRNDLYDTHFNSPAMGVFLTKTASLMSTGFDLTHYTDTAGFLDRSGTCREAGVMYDTRIACASAAARDAVLAKLAKLAKQVQAQYEDTYTFYVLKSLDDETSVRVFERYKDWHAMEAHQRSEGWTGFLFGSKEEVKSLEGRAYVPNGKGWLHH